MPDESAPFEPAVGALRGEPARGRGDLLAASTLAALLANPDLTAAVAEIDPDLSDTAAFCAAYGVPVAQSANCVVLSGKRSGEQRWAAAIILATTRADVNGTARRLMDVRKVSFAPQAEAVAVTGMEYGGITPIGLPESWPIYIDQAVADAGTVIVGSGIRASKLLIDGAALAALPGAVVVPGLASARADL